MSVRQLWEGTDAAGWAQKLNGRTKLLFLFLFAILMITVDNPRTLFILFTFFSYSPLFRASEQSEKEMEWNKNECSTEQQHETA